ncbi:glycoside hydrolase family 97 catalytic domain-containing protein [Alteromonas sp. H39]|uniref:glycoside hydrolase family 97 protein n=1 Tax=Alteromonas sp. H39 TaxID=3389876 RepID=UPI0039DF46FB
MSVLSPDGKTEVIVTVNGGKAYYEVLHNNKLYLEPSLLGLETSIGDFSKDLELQAVKTGTQDYQYRMSRAKASDIHYVANTVSLALQNSRSDVLRVTFQVSNNNVAFRYQVISGHDATFLKVNNELTAFNLPDNARTYITPQALPMTGWMQTKPSYEEPYTMGEKMQTPSSNGVGYTFPALFQLPDEGWVLVSETGVDSHYVGARLSEGNAQGNYVIRFPQPQENAGIGDTSAAMAIPATTPWRTITVGQSLAPIVETTVMFDVVEQKYAPSKQYQTGRATWSWIVWQDDSINEQDQKAFIDMAAQLNFEYVLIDNWWDQRIGRERIEALAEYASNKGVGLLLWYNSNGWWNNAPQTPQDKMNTAVARKKEMAWMQQNGIQGIKVDFFGGDKQATMALYEDILSDANDYGLAVTFHGSTLPRGWEKMYPNFVTSEAVLASENLVFRQDALDAHAVNATVLPFTRNAVGAMDFAPVFLNKRLSRDQQQGTLRTTTDTFELATSILYQSPVQHFGLTPNNLHEQPSHVLQFLREVPADWDETRYIAGKPGDAAVLARRSGQRWYVAAVNGRKQTNPLMLSLPMLAGKNVTLLSDSKDNKVQRSQITIAKDGSYSLSLRSEGGAVFIFAGDEAQTEQ